MCSKKVRSRAQKLTAGAVDNLRQVGDNLDIDGLDDLGGEKEVRLGRVVFLGSGGNVQREDGSVQHILPKSATGSGVRQWGEQPYAVDRGR